MKDAGLARERSVEGDIEDLKDHEELIEQNGLKTFITSQGSPLAPSVVFCVL